MLKTPKQLQSEIDASLAGRSADRYYLRIKTAPHQVWTIPSGWSWSDLGEAKLGARIADRQWMAVELRDSFENGKKIKFRAGKPASKIDPPLDKNLCAYCGKPTRKGSLVLDEGQTAHRSCYREFEK